MNITSEAECNRVTSSGLNEAFVPLCFYINLFYSAILFTSVFFFFFSCLFCFWQTISPRFCYLLATSVFVGVSKPLFPQLYFGISSLLWL